MRFKRHNIILPLSFVVPTVLVGGCTSNLQQSSGVVPIPLVGTNHHLLALANRAARKYGVDRQLFHALIAQESNWNPYALSPRGARGLTQLMPRTGQFQCGLERKVLYDPELNLQCGAFYLGKLLRRFNSVELALAAYNSGETRVARLGHIPRIRETQRYVKQIVRRWQLTQCRRRDCRKLSIDRK